MADTLIGNAPYLENLLPKVGYLSAWETPDAFLKHIQSLDKSKAWHDSGWDNDRGDFTGTKSMEEAMSLAAGWKEGRDKIIMLRDSILASKPQLKKPIVYGIAGSVPNVPRAIAGNPLNMRVLDLAASKRRPVLTLVYNMCSSWSIGAHSISNAASAVAALIDQIENAGFSSEVLAAAITRGYGKKSDNTYKNYALTTCITKNAGQHVDAERLAFFMGHASMFRRLIFADWGSHPSLENILSHGLGTVSDFQPTEEDFTKNVFFIPSIQEVSGLFETDERTMQKGLPFFIEALKKQGCPAFVDKRFKEQLKDAA